MSLFDQWVRLPKVVQYIFWLNLIAAVWLLLYLNQRFTPHFTMIFNMIHYGTVAGIGIVLMKWSDASKKHYSNQNKLPIYIEYALIVLILLTGIYWIKFLLPIPLVMK
ncbi:hypothetical protein C3F34_11570 [Acinetobacter sp. ACNIH2]|uniref:hypothetical protein n=1 Tax=Acinetobacter sp. ACNIH2 TaxID=1758189 RepID=UPI000CDC43AE|nr:hypothetical protein [Acinetobacter sp. ACNIH2]AUX86612.1 hypothetical protein C3F34_11570 [Acinetobacter sp. ACNIH2]